MKVLYSIHESKLATSLSFVGTGLMIAAAIALKSGAYIPSIIMIIAGVAVIGVSFFVNKLMSKSIIKKKIRKALENPQLINNVQKSAVFAYVFYRKNSHELIDDFVKTHNPFAYKRILEFNSKEFAEQEIIAKLKQYDSINTSRDTVQ